MKGSKNPTMQEQLLMTALAQEHIDPDKVKILHKIGISMVDDLPLGIKYPRSFIDKIDNLNYTKKYKYIFKGGFTTSNPSVTIKREDILKSYMSREDSKIIETRSGIKRIDKTSFDKEYYQLIANSYYSLCPNWSGRWWNHDYAWTYRLIETCFAKSIPILFKKAPVGNVFKRDIKFFWSDEQHSISDDQYTDIVNSNYEKALNYWTLTNKEIMILKS